MKLGTPLSPTAVRVMLLGSGELGKEVAIELQRLGCEVIAVDRYADAPAMQVAHRSHVIAMTDAAALRALVEAERPHLIVPEIEAIATEELAAIEAGVRQGWDRFIGEHGAFVGMTGFGASAPAEVLYQHFGITAEAVAAAAKSKL